MKTSKACLLFLFACLQRIATQDIRSMQMILSNGQRFQCAATTCTPSIITTTAYVLQCQIQCLNQIFCKAATFQELNSQCQLFTNNSDPNMILEPNPGSVTMVVISGTRTPPEAAPPLTTSTTATTRTTTTATTSSSSSTTSSTTTSSTTRSTSTSSTSSTTVTTSTTTSTSSTTTRTTAMTWLTTTTEIVYPIWNTTAGRDSTPATAGTNMGNFGATETASNVFDNNTSTKYLNFGSCNSGDPVSLACGINTGLYLTPQRGSSSLVNIQFCTANDVSNRDPLTVTIEGSNQPLPSLPLGSSWTLIYNGSTGLSTVLTRFDCGSVLFVSNSSNWYSSYRILVTSIRGPDVSTQYSELRMIGLQ